MSQAAQMERGREGFRVSDFSTVVDLGRETPPDPRHFDREMGHDADWRNWKRKGRQYDVNSWRILS